VGTGGFGVDSYFLGGVSPGIAWKGKRNPEKAMKNSLRITQSTLLLILLQAGVQSQAPEPSRSFGELQDRTVVAFETPAGFQMAAARWSASVFGRRVSFRTAASSEELSLTPLSFEREGWQYVLDHGVLTGQSPELVRSVSPWASEHFDLSAEGLELSYVFENPLPGSGDLTVRLGVESSLTAPAGTFGEEGLVFRRGRTVIEVGAVLGIDADGNTCPGELHFDGDELALVLPAEFVDGASYPLVLDPIVRPPVRIRTTTNDSLPDVAYDESTGLWACIWDREFPGLHLVLMQRSKFDGVPIGAPILLGNEPEYTKPVLANCTGVDRFVFAYLAGASLGAGPAEIVSGTVRASSGLYERSKNHTINHPVTIGSIDIGASPQERAQIVLGANPGDVETIALEISVFGEIRELGRKALHNGSTFFGLGHDVQISATCGLDGFWALGWEVEDRGFDPEFIKVAIVDLNGSIVLPGLDLEFEPDWSYRDIACSIDPTPTGPALPNYFYFSFVRESVNTVNLDEVWVRRMGYLGGTLFSAGINLTHTVSPGERVAGTAIEYSGTGLAVAWRERSAVGDRIQATSLDAITTHPCEPVVPIAFGDLGAPRMYAITASGTTVEPGPARIVWSEDPPGAPSAIHNLLWEACP
jgi:hypothetical protein